MTPLFPARRSAERFDALVEGARHDADASTAELLELVGALRSAPLPQARPEFVADLREQLMVAARSELVAPAAGSRDDVATRLTIAPRRTRRERRVGVALGAFAIIGATTSMAVASQSALPGDALYPVKRAIENTHTGFSVGDDAKGETILGNASGRLDEVDELTQQSDPDATLGHQHPRHVLRPGDRGRRPAHERLRAARRRGVDRGPPGLHRAQHGRPRRPRAVDPGRGRGRADRRRQGGVPDRPAADQVCPDCAAGITEIPPQLVAGGTTAVDDGAQTLADGPLPGTGEPSPGAPSSPATASRATTRAGSTRPDTRLHPAGHRRPERPHQRRHRRRRCPAPLRQHQHQRRQRRPRQAEADPPVDLTPVTDGVTEVVNGVVNGVNGLLSGLTGQTGQSRSTRLPSPRDSAPSSIR